MGFVGRLGVSIRKAHKQGKTLFRPVALTLTLSRRERGRSVTSLTASKG
jgi:hypothetical protein